MTTTATKNWVPLPERPAFWSFAWPLPAPAPFVGDGGCTHVEPIATTIQKEDNRLHAQVPVQHEDFSDLPENERRFLDFVAGRVAALWRLT